jgi:hypothetical protein
MIPRIGEAKPLPLLRTKVHAVHAGLSLLLVLLKDLSMLEMVLLSPFLNKNSLIVLVDLTEMKVVMVV